MKSGECSSGKQTTLKMSRILLSPWAGTEFITNCVSVPHFSYSENLHGIYIPSRAGFCIISISSTRICLQKCVRELTTYVGTMLVLLINTNKKCI